MMKKKYLILFPDSKMLISRKFYFNIQEWLYHLGHNNSREGINPVTV